MKDHSLLKFFRENQVHCSWRGDMLIAWIGAEHLPEFCKAIYSILSNGGLDCILQDDAHIAVNLVPVCRRYGIRPEMILPHEQIIQIASQIPVEAPAEPEDAPEQDVAV